MLGVLRGLQADRAYRRDAGEGAEVFFGEGFGGDDDRGGAVGGGADVEQAQWVGDDGGGQDVVDGGFFAVAGVGVVQAVAGVFDFHVREVFEGGAVEVHAAPGEH